MIRELACSDEAWRFERNIIALLCPHRLDEIIGSSDKLSVCLHEAAFALGLVKPEDFYKTLAKRLSLNFLSANDTNNHIDIQTKLPDYNSNIITSGHVRLVRGGYLIAPSGRRLLNLVDQFLHKSAHPQTILTTPITFRNLLYQHYASAITEEARDQLRSVAQGLSAFELTTKKYLTKSLYGLGIIAVIIVILPYSLIVNLLSAIFLLLILMRLFAPLIIKAPPKMIFRPQDKHKGFLSLLVPLYDEADVVKQLIQALQSTNLSPSHYEVLLLLEEEDHATRLMIEACDLPYNFMAVTVPSIGPQTKPKALNVGLVLARGDYIGIYDAEDLPAPDQLDEVLAILDRTPREIACIQAPLTIYNGSNSWLTGCFAADYSLLFRFILPLAERWKAPIPLGGTSNFFRASVLKQVGGWDPYNVTEDADLGLRLAQFDFKTILINKETLEEAPTNVKNWISQRTRWYKGWLQTLFVQLNRKQTRKVSVDALRLWVVYGFVFATLCAALIHPVILGFLAFSIIYDLVFSHALAANTLFLISSTLLAYMMTALAMGFGSYQTSVAINPFSLIAIPLFWVLISYSAYRAILHLLTVPFQWEKTPHVGADKA